MRALGSPTGIEQEVVVTVVERTVFDNLALVAVDASSSDCQVLNDLVLKAGGRQKLTIRAICDGIAGSPALIWKCLEQIDKETK